MPRLMDMGLERITDTMLEMASLSEKSVATAIEAYESGSKLGEEIREWSDELRKQEDEVGELAVELLARYQPVASDLRYIRSCMEISYGFSRFGRYALDIAEVLEMFGDLSSCERTDVELAAKATKEMIRMSIEAFTTRDVELAKKIATMDDYVDDKYRSHIMNVIKQPVANMICAMSTTLILRYLERIADHSAYIGDCVVYIVTGERSFGK